MKYFNQLPLKIFLLFILFFTSAAHTPTSASTNLIKVGILKRSLAASESINEPTSLKKNDAAIKLSKELSRNSKNDKSFILKGTCTPSPKSQCKMCPGGARSGHDGCEETGKRRDFLCIRSIEADDDDNNNKDNENYSGDSRIKVYMSCHRTRLEEEYLVMQLQVFCAIVAFMSLKSVRREKILIESLFDNRKRSARQAQVAQNQQEMTPLTTTRGGSRDSNGDEECGRMVSGIVQSIHSTRSNESLNS